MNTEQQTLEFTKVGENSNQRFYKLSIAVEKVPNPDFNWEKEKDNFHKRVKKEYKDLLTEKIQYVCVSDAHTHVERLLFLAIYAPKEDEFYCVTSIQLDGKHTMMIHGGSSRDVHPDEVYLRRLASANSFKMGKVYEQTDEKV